MILVVFVSVSIDLQGSFTLLVAVLKRSMQAPQILSDFFARGPMRATSESTSKPFVLSKCLAASSDSHGFLVSGLPLSRFA